MNINSLAASRKFSDEESSAEDVVDTWEDLVDDEEDQPVGAKSTGALEGKSAKEDLVRDSDLQVAADLFGTPAAKDEGFILHPPFPSNSQMKGDANMVCHRYQG